MHTELVVRFDYGSVVPWVIAQAGWAARADRGAGPADLRYESLRCMARICAPSAISRSRRRGGRLRPQLDAVLPAAIRPRSMPGPPLRETEAFWRDWMAAAPAERPNGTRPCFARSLTLKALAHCETGGIVRRRTTSLPEKIGGPAQLGLPLLLAARCDPHALRADDGGLSRRGAAWRTWLLRAIAGSPEQTADHVRRGRRAAAHRIRGAVAAGYEDSAPVRVGNAAHGQLQLDVYGEVLDALYVGRRLGLPTDASSWALRMRAARPSGNDLATSRTRASGKCAGRRRHFTHSKVMAWVAFDRAVTIGRGVRPGRARWSAGCRCVTASMPTSAGKGSTPS